ncbi:UNVERIFIED_CONTAM: hypothetical protein RMT77_013052 [Armadillidium vulgare]
MIIIIIFFSFCFCNFSESMKLILPSVRSCKEDSQCQPDEICDVISETCSCREGKIKENGKDICLIKENFGGSCEHDVQCHQFQKLGSICENNRCVCPRNVPPIEGRCPSYGSSIEYRPNEENITLSSRRRRKIYPVILFTIGIISFMVVALVFLFFLVKKSLRRKVNFDTASGGSSANESSGILNMKRSSWGSLKRSRPPSYSSLPRPTPPSYEDTASNILPTSLTALWKGCKAAPEKESNSETKSGEARTKENLLESFIEEEEGSPQKDPQTLPTAPPPNEVGDNNSFSAEI